MAALNFIPGSEKDTVSFDNLIKENKELLNKIEVLTEKLSAIEALADTDTLTPVANRRSFVRELDKMIRKTERHGTHAAVLFVDVDGLKAVNDAYGHRAGDAILIHVATELPKRLRATDMVARLGGDEFGLILDYLSEADVRTKAASIISGINATPIIYGAATIYVRVSWGMTMVCDGDSVEDAIARADAAMYATKAAQRSER